MAKIPIDPATSLPLALAGRVVTMNKTGSVVDAGVVYSRYGSITDIRPVGASPPPGYENVPVIQTGGTIFPGLIELHNHLPYDILSLWQVPKRFGDRDQWSGPSTPDYHRLVSGPMRVLGTDEEAVPAIVRYVEMRCLLGGTTTSQGVSLASNAGIVKHFRGLVRNVESTGNPDLPPAATHIADVEAVDAEHFLARISGRQKTILHLAEGTDESAHRHFKALQFAPGKWAITSNLIGIHCVALTAEDMQIFADHGGSMVWSPYSNLLLYGATANVDAALKHHVPIALGSDWSPSGSKNLLGELKVARLAAENAGIEISAADLIAMVTRTPAQMLGWGDELGSLEPGKRADFVVIDGSGPDPYQLLVDATEASITLVIINGIPRVGTVGIMGDLGLQQGERISVASQPRILNLAQATADEAVAALSVAESVSRLERALAALPNAAPSIRTFTGTPPMGSVWLAVDGVIDNHMSSRPHLPYNGEFTGPNFRGRAPATSARSNDPLPALTLEPLTAVDNAAFYDMIRNEPNLPPSVRDGLFALKPH